MQNIGSCILLSVHGICLPGEEITEQLRNVLQRRLNSKTLEEIQNALMKNAQIRLEWSDIRVNFMKLFLKFLILFFLVYST